MDEPNLFQLDIQLHASLGDSRMVNLLVLPIVSIQDRV